ncbi:KIF-1 binding protein C terminal-domain-containing protein [Cladochytrium replicatum]|nr:KIF-1 binding protein C terminal-domain-containing protein [Cladochytrium replicatum]
MSPPLNSPNKSPVLPWHADEVVALLSSEEFQNDFKDYVRLRTEPSPASEPFRSLYAGKAKLEALKSKVDALELSSSEERAEKEIVLALLQYHLGVILANTEENSGAIRTLSACLETLSDVGAKPDFVVAVVDGLNQLGTLYFDVGEPKRSLSYLLKASSAFTGFLKTGTQPVVDVLLLPENRLPKEEQRAEFENLHTHTLYYLAQVYSALGLQDKSAESCRATLERQITRKDLNKLTWAIDAMTLSQYFTQTMAYPLAHHCLSAAEHMLSEAEQQVAQSGATVADSEGGVGRARADLEWIWGKFYVNALTVSSERILQNEDNRSTSPDKEEDVIESLAGMKLFEALEFATKRPAIPPFFARTQKEAQVLFLEGLQALEKARSFYKFDGFVSDYVGIIQDMSSLYRLLSSFQDDQRRQIQMHKRAAELLIAVYVELSSTPPGSSNLAVVNPPPLVIHSQHFVPLVRTIVFEIASTYEAMAESEGDVFVAAKSDTSESAQDIKAKMGIAIRANQYTYSGIRYFNEFISTFVDSRTKKVIEALGEDDVKPLMSARWRCARLWSRLIPVPEDGADATTGAGERQMREKKHEGLKMALAQYQAIQEQHQRQVIPDFEAEMDVITQMITLLPLQIRSLGVS